MDLNELQNTLTDYALATNNRELFEIMTKNDVKTYFYLVKTNKRIGEIISDTVRN